MRENASLSVDEREDRPLHPAASLFFRLRLSSFSSFLWPLGRGWCGSVVRRVPKCISAFSSPFFLPLPRRRRKGLALLDRQCGGDVGCVFGVWGRGVRFSRLPPRQWGTSASWAGNIGVACR